MLFIAWLKSTPWKKNNPKDILIIRLTQFKIFFQIFLNLWQGTSPSFWGRKKRSIHLNQHNTGNIGLGASRRESIQNVFSPPLSLKSRRRQRLKRSLSGLSDGLSGDNTHTVSSYPTSTSAYSGSGSGDYGSGSGDYGSGSGHYGSGYASDDTWSYFQDYKAELTQYVQDEWNQRVTKFQEEFQKNPRYYSIILWTKRVLFWKPIPSILM